MSMESFGNIWKNIHDQKASFDSLKNEILHFAASRNKYVSSKIIFTFVIFV